jgi:citrate lyase subunit beta/citryl-CoA lyase
MRSMLFVPGDSPRKFDRALTSGASALILDLEDAVAPDHKDAAREAVRTMLNGPRGSQSLFVRVNGLDTGRTLEDLAAIMPAAPSGIVIPKCQSGDDVRRIAGWLDAFEAGSGLMVGSTRIMPIATETAASIFGLNSYQNCSPRLVGLMWGAEDLAASLGATENGRDGTYHSPYRLARDMCLMAAAAAGVSAIDAVVTDIDNLDGLNEEAIIARRDGFSGKAVIHPKHVAIVNAAFEPSGAEREWAERIVAAFANAAHAGVLRLDGKMIDRPHLRAARTLLGLME